jgi:hypothetical protein
MPGDKKPITKEQAEVYEIIFNMFMRFILMAAGLVAFFIVLAHLISDPNFNNKLVYGGLNAILAGSIFVVYRYYFTKDKPKTPRKKV